jgi:hypothetical protein
MKIAILGWGSLVWDPQSLKDHLEDNGNFKQGGPKLLLEFSRISEDRRLTLVVDEKNGRMLPTRVATSKQLDLEEAMTDLLIREAHWEDSSDQRSAAQDKNKDEGWIGYTDLSGEKDSIRNHPDHKFAHDLIREWLPNSGFEGVVWTALPSNYKRKTGRDFSVEDADNYLEKLPEASRKSAFEYIQKAPEEVDTPLRIRLKDRIAGEHAEVTTNEKTEAQRVAATGTQAPPPPEPASPSPTRSEFFTPDQTEKLKREIEDELKKAVRWGSVNCAFDLIFKVVLLILGIVSATDAGLIATIWKTGSPPRWATILNIVVGVLIAALAGFATAQVNFSARTDIYRKKETALRILIDALKYLNPDKAVFLKALQEIYSWNDSTPPTVQIPKLAFSGLDDERHTGTSK